MRAEKRITTGGSGSAQEARFGGSVLRRAALASVSTLSLVVGIGAVRAETISNGDYVTVSPGVATPGSPWTTGNLYIGVDALGGQLEVLDGGVVTTVGSGWLAVGDPTSDGGVYLDGAGSTWNVTGDLIIGADGSGAVNVAGSANLHVLGQVHLADSDLGGVLTVVDGATASVGSLSVGTVGQGVVNVFSGSGLTVLNNATLGGVGVSGSADVLVLGAGAHLDVLGEQISIGASGAAFLDAQAGGAITAKTILVGGGKSGKLVLTDGAVVNTRKIGRVSGGAADVYIDGGTIVYTGTIANDGKLFEDFADGEIVIGADGATIDTKDQYVFIDPALTGTGGLVKKGSGTLRLTGSNTYLGGTEVAEGAVSGTTDSLQGTFQVDLDALLKFEQDFNGSFAGGLTGVGHVQKLGSGTVKLDGDSPSYQGILEVLGGGVAVNGDMHEAGALVGADGRLGGNGTLKNIIVNGGTLAPGNSIGTLNTANATFGAGSTYEVELKAGGNTAGTHNDLLNASGTVTIGGGTVHVQPENGTDNGSTYKSGLTYTIISAAGGVSGTFDALTDDYAFLDFLLSYDANNVFLTSNLLATSFCLDGMTVNQCATGDGAFSMASGPLFDAIANLSAADAPAALDQLSGEVHASVKTALIDDSRFAREVALDRVRRSFATAGGSGGKRASGDEALWFQGFGSRDEWDGDGNAAAMARSIGGFFLGGDAAISDNVRLGAFGGYSNSSFTIGERLSSGTAGSWTVGAYGGAQWAAGGGEFALRGGAAYSWHDLNIDRAVRFKSFTESPSSSYDAATAQVFGEAAYGIDAGPARFEPFVNLAYVNLHTGGFEEDEGVAALTAEGGSSDATFATLGVRAQTMVDLGGMAATLRGTVGYQRAFGGTPTSTHAFSVGDAFTVAGVPFARDTLLLDAGFDLNLTDRATLGLSYNGRFGSGFQAQGLKADLHVAF